MLEMLSSFLAFIAVGPGSGPGPVTVPEPATMALFAMGAAGIGYLTYRTRHRSTK